MILALLISLLINKNGQTLDPNYCSQYPIDQGQLNVLHLLHFHLNHESNQPIVAKLSGIVRPKIASLRLLKLLCAQLTDFSIYHKSQWRKIETGAYGQIYECQVNLKQPNVVAIKQLNFPQSIHERSVLHDIFNEITCLQTLRMNPAVVDLYDFGVTSSTDYLIVMKLYKQSLKSFVLEEIRSKADFRQNLHLYLTIFRDVLYST